MKLSRFFKESKVVNRRFNQVLIAVKREFEPSRFGPFGLVSVVAIIDCTIKLLKKNTRKLAEFIRFSGKKIIACQENGCFRSSYTVFSIFFNLLVATTLNDYLGLINNFKQKV